jgi:hypothetical protein
LALVEKGCNASNIEENLTHAAGKANVTISWIGNPTSRISLPHINQKGSKQSQHQRNSSKTLGRLKKIDRIASNNSVVHSQSDSRLISAIPLRDVQQMYQTLQQTGGGATDPRDIHALSSKTGRHSVPKDCRFSPKNYANKGFSLETNMFEANLGNALKRTIDKDLASFEAFETHVEKKLTKLSHNQTVALSRAELHVNDTFSAAKEFVPMSFVFAKELKEYAKQKGMKTIQRAIHKLRFQMTAEFLAKWKVGAAFFSIICFLLLFDLISPHITFSYTRSFPSKMSVLPK